MEEQDELVNVLNTTDSTLLPLIRSVLEAAGIPHVVQGEAHLFPLGAAARNVTSRVLGASVLVPRSRSEEARALLETSAEPDPE